MDKMKEMQTIVFAHIENAYFCHFLLIYIN